MPISKAWTFAIFTNKIKCVDHNWNIYLLIASNEEYFRTHPSFQRNDDAIYQGLLGPEVLT